MAGISPIGEIAARVGFRDTTAFIRDWTHATGVTPGRRRREHGGPEDGAPRP